MDEMNQEIALSMMNINCLPVANINHDTNRYVQFPLSRIALMGSAFSMLPSAIQRVTTSTHAGKQLFEAIIPANGELVHSKNGQGYRSMVRDSETKKFIPGHADYVPVDSAEDATTTLTVDPGRTAQAIALMAISMQITEVKETSDDIIAFLETDKQAAIKADLNAMSEIIENFKYNIGDEQYKNTRIGHALAIKKEADQNIHFYRDFIENKLSRQTPLHLNTEKTLNEIQTNFKFYRLSLYLYALSSYVETILLGNYKPEYLKNIAQRIRDYSLQYKFDYSKAYGMIEQYIDTSAQSLLLSGVSELGKLTGDAAEKIPALKKTSFGENLKDGSDKLKKVNDEFTRQTINQFICNRDCGIDTFANQLDFLNTVSNNPIHVLFDNENLYVDTKSEPISVA